MSKSTYEHLRALTSEAKAELLAFGDAARLGRLGSDIVIMIWHDPAFARNADGGWRYSFEKSGTLYEGALHMYALPGSRCSADAVAFLSTALWDAKLRRLANMHDNN